MIINFSGKNARKYLHEISLEKLDFFKDIKVAGSVDEALENESSETLVVVFDCFKKNEENKKAIEFFISKKRVPAVMNFIFPEKPLTAKKQEELKKNSVFSTCVYTDFSNIPFENFFNLSVRTEMLLSTVTDLLGVEAADLVCRFLSGEDVSGVERKEIMAILDRVEKFL